MKDLQRFENREEAGRELAARLQKFATTPDVNVFALPKGGVIVGAVVAAILNKPFDILLVGKISLPGVPGKVVGSITAGGVRMLNYAMIDRMNLSESEIRRAILEQSLKLVRRRKVYCGNHPSLEVADHTVILVDDGATPFGTLRDAIRLMRRQHAERIVVALPIISGHAASDLRLEADELVSIAEPAPSIPVRKRIQTRSRKTDAEASGLLLAG